jgi:rubrerythrin
MIQKKQPESVSLGAEGLMNRTGIGASPVNAKEMVEGATGEPIGPDGERVTAVRRFYLEEADPIGTMPPPTTMKGAVETVKEALTGAKATVFIDKIAERLAYERTGTRFYEALITKFDVLGAFEGGPSRAELVRIRDEELSHFHMLKQCMEKIGADPTAITPSADLAAVEGMGIGQVLGDPRTTLAQGLHAILAAEVVDKAGWELLIDLADGLGQTEFVEHFRRADAQELEHFVLVKGWLGAYTAGVAGVAPPAAPRAGRKTGAATKSKAPRKSKKQT